MNGIGLCIDIETCRIEGIVPPPPVVAYGNTVDPLKRKIKEDEATEKQIERLALDPHCAAVCCYVGIAFDLTTGKILEVESRVMNGPPSIKYDRGEREMLSIILDTMSHAAVIVTFGGTDFDFPFILRRSMLMWAEVPVRPFIPRGLWYRSRLHPSSPSAEVGPHNADVYAILSESHSNAANCRATLDAYMQVILGWANRADVDCPELDKGRLDLVLAQNGGPQKICSMCEAHCRNTLDIYKAIERYYP